MKVVFFGTPTFAAEVLKYLLDQHVNVVAVVTRPDKAVGRSSQLVPTPVKVVAMQNLPSIPVHQPPLVSSPDFADVLPKYDADLFVVVAYGEIIKQHVLDMPKLGCINLHGSLLPKFRGAAPIQHSIIQGEKETGVTIMHMVRKMDAGDIIKTVTVPIGQNDTYGDLEKQLCLKGSKLMLEVIHDFQKGKVQETLQDHSTATYASKIEMPDCEVNWNKTAEEIHNLVRGVTPSPGAWCRVWVQDKQKRLKIKETRLAQGVQGKPGEITSCTENGLTVACGKNAVCITRLQLEGKKEMVPRDLLRGTDIHFFQK